jgi:hypothetical protein
LRQGSYLIVLDNLESFAAAQEIAHQLHALVSSPANPHPSKILITSRERLLHDPLVYDYFIQGLSEPATIDLLQAEAKSRGADLLAQTHQYDQRIYKTTGGMPLAIILIVTQFLLGISLDQELDRLEQTTNEEDLYRFIYFSIWEKLNIPAKKVLVGAATFGTSAQRDHLIRVSKTQSPDFEKAVADLIHFSLMEVFHYPSLNQQRYDIHPLTRWFVNGPLTDLWEQQRKQS